MKRHLGGDYLYKQIPSFFRHLVFAPRPLPRSCLFFSANMGTSRIKDIETVGDYSFKEVNLGQQGRDRYPFELNYIDDAQLKALFTKKLFCKAIGETEKRIYCGRSVV